MKEALRKNTEALLPKQTEFPDISLDYAVPRDCPHCGSDIVCNEEVNDRERGRVTFITVSQCTACNWKKYDCEEYRF